MELTRRGFLAGAGATVAALAEASGEVEGHDPNLVALLADIHLLDNSVRWKNGPMQSSVVLPQLVKEILSLRPLPANAVVLGDFSASSGWDEDLRLAASFLKPLAEAGITLSFAMGNHDNRAAFLRTWPEYKERLLVPNRIVSKVSTPNADLILLDTLKCREGMDWAEPKDGGNFVEGAMDEAQREWLRGELAATARPTFLCAHHCAREAGIVRDAVIAPTVFGYIFGHEHTVAESFLHDGYSNSQTVQTETLPSGGYWGDIGYALFRTFPDRAELTFRQTDFYFNRRWADRPRPKNWLERVKAHDGRTVTFWYDKPGNFYKG